MYYFYNWLIRSATEMAVDHNTVRITSAVVVVVCSLASAWIVLRLTQSLAAASVTHILVFRSLAFFDNEPGHPQELCMLLLLAFAASGFLAEKPRTRWLAMASAGALAAALMLVKVNIGIFAILAVALAVLLPVAARAGSGARQNTRPAAGALLLPFALMRIHLNDPAALAYCVVVTASIAGVLVGAPGFARPGSFSVSRVLGRCRRFRRHLRARPSGSGGARRSAVTRLRPCWFSKHVRLNVNQGALVSRRRTATHLDCVGLDRVWPPRILVARAIRARAKPSVITLLPPFQVLFGGTGSLDRDRLHPASCSVS